MSIPHSKRQGITDFLRNHGPESIRRIPQLRACECTATNCFHRKAPGRQEAPSSQGRADAAPPAVRPRPHRVVPAATALILITGLLVSIVPEADAQLTFYTEGFETYTPGTQPTTSPDYAFTTGGGVNTFVSTAQEHSGNQSLKYQPLSASSISFTYDMDTGVIACGATSGVTPIGGSTFQFWLWIDSYVPVGGLNTFSLATFASVVASMTIPSTGIISFTGPSGAAITPGTMPLNTWVDFQIQAQCVASGVSVGNQKACMYSAYFDFNGCTVGVSSTIGGTNNLRFLSSRDSASPFTQNQYLDDFSASSLAAPFPTPSSSQASVTNLVGYSMDAGGNNIIVRTEGGANVRTYNANDLTTEIASAATPNCARPDAVLSVILTDPENGQQEIWTTHGDCDGSGDVDTLKIRDGALGIPAFPDTCEGETEEDVENGGGGFGEVGDIDVPNNMQQMGTIADMAFDYRECINPSGLARGAFASWTFSSSFDGWIGAFAAAYGRSPAGIEWIESWEEHATPPLDQSAGTKIVDSFCSWVGPDFKDYIAGVSSNGAAGIYEVVRDATVNTGGGGAFSDVDFTFIQKFRNTGTYGNSNGIDCAQDKVVISTLGGIRVLRNVTTTPSSMPGWPIVQAGVTERPVAITGSADFVAVASASGIRIYHINGTQTAQFALPSGTFRGMEFSFSGDKLAVFTSTLITVYDTGVVTCEIEGDCEELGGGTDDDPSPTSTSGPTSGTGGEGFGDAGDNLEDSPYFWVFLWMVVLLVATAWLSYASRGGFPPIVYGIEALAVYVIGILYYGADDINPWPVVVMVAVTIGLVIWSRR